MNLLEILKSRVDSLQDGEYIPGLRAVLSHAEVAVNHLKRGQVTTDETAYTDAVYRTNQAFEGSLKEAYRVLAGKSPNNIRPYDIETYIETENLLRPRVLAQLTNYRKEWRNPSTHDYQLNFDDDEALLAIVSVCAFSIVLIDQMAERLSFEKAKEETAKLDIPPDPTLPLVERVYELLKEFCHQFKDSFQRREDVREGTVTGALAGFLSKTAPNLRYEMEASLGKSISQRADVKLTEGNENLIIEVKLLRATSASLQVGIQQLQNYMSVSSINLAILFLYGVPNSGKVVRTEHVVPEGTIHVMTTEK